jgi:integron integrase
MTNPGPRLSQRFVEATRRALVTRGYQPRTVDTYAEWLRRFMAHLGHPHPRRLDPSHIRAYLRHLSGPRRLAPKTRNQAASALTFAYREILNIPVEGLIEHARTRNRVPVVLSHHEVQRLLDEMKGRKKLAASLMYGTGARVSEALGLRIKDLDFELGRITIREGKGGRARIVMLPSRLQPDLEELVRKRRKRHQDDLDHGHGWSPLPAALDRKIPRAGWEDAWQFLFASRIVQEDPATGRRGRHPLHPTAMQRAVKKAVRHAGILKPATCHTLRHSFATQMLRDGYDIRTVQQLLGHKDVRTTMIYTHVVDQVGFRVRSPLDRDPTPQ